MTHVPSAELTGPPRWVCVLLGIAMILGGFLVLSDVAFFTVISALIIGWTAIAVGAFEIVHAFWTKGWGGLLWQVFLGVLYIAFGIAILSQPVTGALLLTTVLGFVILVSGVIRILIGMRQWQHSGWIMVASGVFGILAGTIILTGFPASGLWVLGLLLAIDLLSHGIGWLSYAWWRTSPPA